MANFIYQGGSWLLFDNPISSSWATTAFILSSLMMWERLVVSIRIQNLMDAHGGKK
jgi:hypothetical protein